MLKISINKMTNQHMQKE